MWNTFASAVCEEHLGCGQQKKQKKRKKKKKKEIGNGRLTEKGRRKYWKEETKRAIYEIK